MSLATDLRPTEHLFYRHMSGGRPQTMSSWKGGVGGVKNRRFHLSKRQQSGGWGKIADFQTT